MALLKPIENGKMYPGWWRWNPIGGCEHDCSYCSIKRIQKRAPDTDMVTPVFRNGENGTKNYLNDNLYKEYCDTDGIIRGTKKIFCCSSGDAWGDWVPQKWQRDMLEHCVRHPDNEYMFLTKNPANYLKLSVFQAGELDCILGTTIETDASAKLQEVGIAPDPLFRIEFIKRVGIENPVQTMISVEPVMKFTEDFGKRLEDTQPGIVYIGVDSGGNGLPEPTRDELARLIIAVGEFTDVRLKNGIERILGAELYAVLEGRQLGTEVIQEPQVPEGIETCEAFCKDLCTQRR